MNPLKFGSDLQRLDDLAPFTGSESLQGRRARAGYCAEPREVVASRRPRAWLPCLIGTIACVFLALGPSRLGAQTDEESQAAPASQPAAGRPSGGPASQAGQPSDKPGESPEGGKPAGKPGEAKADKDKQASGDAAPVRRPAKPLEPPNPDEFKVRPDERGRLRFSFNGQPWPDVLEWLADVSGASLDWQEIPGDYLNFTTRRGYTVDETRDLFNRHLMARGFTLLRNGEVLTVVKLEKLNPSMVPRVAPEDLAYRDPHEFVRVSFSLDWLLAETAVEEFKPMLSSHGKIFKLGTTNRIEAIDCAANLREIHTLLQEEQSSTGQERLVREFRLEHTRAGEVLDMLEALLGIEKKSGPSGPMSPQQMQQMQQQMQQMEQMAQRAGQKPGQGGPGKEPEIHLVVNPRENSILAHAPPDKMAIVEQAVRTLDVPSSRGRSLVQSIQRMQIYRLASLEPEPLVKVLDEIGNLDPLTRLEVDKKNRSIIAYATLADHLTIRQLVEKLDGSDRQFEVIRLRRLEADYVAGTIEFMMGGGEEKDKSRNNRYSPYYYSFSRQQEEPESPTGKFRVDADVEHNRLLLWANEIELQEVENLLVKLGEIPARGTRNTLRVLDLPAGAERDALLERIRRIWPGIGPNELQIDPVEEPRLRKPDVEDRETKHPGPDSRSRETLDTRLSPHNPPPRRMDSWSVHNSGDAKEVTQGRTRDPSYGDSASGHAGESGRVNSQRARTVPAVFSTNDGDLRDVEGDEDFKEELLAFFEGGEQDASKLDRSEPIEGPEHAVAERRRPAPIRIVPTPDGRVGLASEDHQALDRLEDLIAELAPPRKDYKIFQLKHHTTWAYGVALNLEDFFKENDTKDNGRSQYYSWYWGMPSNDKSDDGRSRLSKRRPLKFIADSDTNTILVQGADPHQLKTIEELIELYDRPPATEGKAQRKTKIFRVRYSQAKVIGEAIKDLYRDLLSPTDKALINPNQQQQQNQGTTVERSFTYVFGGDDRQSEPESPIRFKGLLSIGIDEISNTLVVSATEGLLENIGQVIESLDEAARPEEVARVRRFNSKTDPDELLESLRELMSDRPTIMSFGGRSAATGRKTSSVQSNPPSRQPNE
jgi:hypothetical protein